MNINEILFNLQDYRFDDEKECRAYFFGMREGIQHTISWFRVLHNHEMNSLDQHFQMKQLLDNLMQEQDRCIKILEVRQKLKEIDK